MFPEAQTQTQTHQGEYGVDVLNPPRTVFGELEEKEPGKQMLVLRNACQGMILMDVRVVLCVGCVWRGASVVTSEGLCTCTRHK